MRCENHTTVHGLLILTLCYLPSKTVLLTKQLLHFIFQSGPATNLLWDGGSGRKALIPKESRPAAWSCQVRTSVRGPSKLGIRHPTGECQCVKILTLTDGTATEKTVLPSVGDGRLTLRDSSWLKVRTAERRKWRQSCGEAGTINRGKTTKLSAKVVRASEWGNRVEFCVGKTTPGVSHLERDQASSL